MIKIVAVQTKEQIQGVASVAKRIWQEHYTSIIGEKQVAYMLEHFQSQKAMEKQMQEGYQYYIFMDKDIIVGYMGFVIEKEKIFLSKLYLIDEVRGKGISRQALIYIEAIAKDKGIKSIYLTCNKNNLNSLQAYKHLGFQNVNTQIADIGQGYIMDDYILEKRIDVV